MNLLDLRCTDETAWMVGETGAKCPDCAALVPPDAIAEHVAWHELLLCQLIGVCEHHDELSHYTREFDLGTPGEIVRLLHQLQIDRLRDPSPTSRSADRA